MFEALRERIAEMLGKEEIHLSSYAFIDWHPDAEKHNFKGDNWKRIWYLRSGADRFEILPYTNEIVEMLKIKGIPKYDSTLGYSEPLGNINPADFEFIKLGQIKRPIAGIEVRR